MSFQKLSSKQVSFMDSKGYSYRLDREGYISSPFKSRGSVSDNVRHAPAFVISVSSFSSLQENIEPLTINCGSLHRTFLLTILVIA